MSTVRLILMTFATVVFALTGGCDRGYTEYYPVNRSAQKLHVTVLGLQPDLFPERLNAGTGTSRLKENVVYLSEPVTVAEAIVIRWTTDDNGIEREVTLRRADFDVPARIQGGRITITYSSDEKWDVAYSDE